MNILLLFFALPVATIILAIVLEKIIKNPFLTAATFFAIYLIVAFTAFDSSFLVFVIAYTILAYITAVIVNIICERHMCCNRRNNRNDTITLSDQDITRIANTLAEIQNNNNSNCGCNNNNNASDVATVNVTNNTTGGRTTWCCYRR